MDWIALTDRLPDEGVVVDTKIDDAKGVRNEQPLKRRGRLWFMEDGSMYVYYSPTHWRPADPQEVAKRIGARVEQLDTERARLVQEWEKVLGQQPDSSCADCHGFSSEEAREAGRLGGLARKAKHDARKAG